MVQPLRISLAAARVNAGLKQEDVASKLGVGKQAVVDWEKGRKAPKWAYVVSLSNLYGIPVDNIIWPDEAPFSTVEEVRT